ncbi:hypothetical protein PIB30_074323 [Stylosanthes scabra]|uniref:Uncharacterized protein n=1 Tax=Stylosanthes scabra TaxID=79078 RepID=A0ABU6UP50_9FABA|nr:hypothetical protein [Stylosanthes scabra]
MLICKQNLNLKSQCLSKFLNLGGSIKNCVALQVFQEISIQKCNNDGDNMLRMCHYACQSYNLTYEASLDCNKQTLFSNEKEGEGQCTGSHELKLSWFNRFRSSFTFTLRDSSSKGISVRDN